MIEILKRNISRPAFRMTIVLYFTIFVFFINLQTGFLDRLLLVMGLESLGVFSRLIIVVAFSILVATLIFRFAEELSRTLTLSSEVSQYAERPSLRMDFDFDTFQSRIEKILKEENQQAANVDLSEDEKNSIVQGVIEKSTVSLDAKLIEELGNQFFRNKAEGYQEKALQRLSQNLEALGSRANFNLFFGLVVAFIGIAIIYLAFFAGVQQFVEQQSGDLIDLIVGYLPRLSMVLIVEAVAFFFLRMYARTLSEIRYVQNEITNVEMKLVALHTALAFDEEDVVKEICAVLGQTERNFVIEKGQTTIEIETERASSESFATALKSASELVQGVRGNASK